MNIWLLTRIDDRSNWGYDEAYRFIVAAPTEVEARSFAERLAGEEAHDNAFWIRDDLVSCEPIGAAYVLVEPGVIMREYREA